MHICGDSFAWLCMLNNSCWRRSARSVSHEFQTIALWRALFRRGDLKKLGWEAAGPADSLRSRFAVTGYGLRGVLLNVELLMCYLRNWRMAANDKYKIFPTAMCNISLVIKNRRANLQRADLQRIKYQDSASSRN